MTSIKNKAIIGAIIALSSLTITSNAMAGFEWKPPVMPDPVITESVMDNSIEPVLEERFPEITMDPMPIANSSTVSSSTPEQISLSENNFANKDNAGDIIDGFGNDINLMIALEQIAPSNYQFIFDRNVNISQKTSWQGGEPWKIVLGNVLDKANLMMSVDGNLIRINNNNDLAVNTPFEKETPVVATYINQGNSMDYTTKDLNIDLDPAPKADTNFSWMGASSAYHKSKHSYNKEETVVKPISSNNFYSDMIAPISYTPKIINEVNSNTSWNANPNDKLSDTLKKWSESAEINFLWSIDYDYKLDRSINLDGDFEEAVVTLLEQYKNAKPQPYGELSNNASGQKTLTIKSYDLQN